LITYKNKINFDFEVESTLGGALRSSIFEVIDMSFWAPDSFHKVLPNKLTGHYFLN